MAKRKGFGGFPGGFGGGFGGAGMNQLLQQAQKMQRDMEAAQTQINSMEIEAAAGGGMVKAKINGEHKLLSIEIKPEAVDPDDIELLQDMIVAAVNEAERLLAEKREEMMPKMPSMPGGLF